MVNFHITSLNLSKNLVFLFALVLQQTGMTNLLVLELNFPIQILSNFDIFSKQHNPWADCNPNLVLQWGYDLPLYLLMPLQ